MGSCASCEVTWQGNDPCWVCGGESTGRFGWASFVTPSQEQKNPPVLPLQADGHVAGWESRGSMAVWVREQLAARLPWLRLESGGAAALPVALVCLLGVLCLIAAGVR